MDYQAKFATTQGASLSSTGVGGVNSLGPSGMGLGAESEAKFTIKGADISVSNKVTVKPQKPSPQYVELTFNKEAEASLFTYMVFQNFYTHSITIRQFKLPEKSSQSTREEMRHDSNWITVLKNYQLMKNAQFENDAQNWHIVGTELFNSRFDRKNLKSLRVYMKQPSPNWLDNTFRNITCYIKKIEVNSTDVNASCCGREKGNAFDLFKFRLKNNIKGVQKQGNAPGEDEGAYSEGINHSYGYGSNHSKEVGQVMAPTSNPNYNEDIRRVEICFNVH